MYKSRYFKLYELLPKELYSDEEYGWEFIDERLLRSIDFVRDLLNMPLICNNWKWGGKRNYSCVRTPESSDYKFGSYHSLRSDRKVMAIDVISTKMTAKQMRNIIVANKANLPFPIRLEDDVTWLHLDVANNVNKDVYIFKK